jgi:iron complex transport system ATP-binding protein
MVELREVSHRAGGVTILDAVSLRFERGKFNVVIGPNGAGKSTLLRIATGLLRPTAGNVWYDGRPLASHDAGELARMRAMLPQHVELAFPLAVSDVVMMGRYPHYGRSPSARDREVVQRALDTVGMSGKDAQLYPTLSGGEQQKVQLARVLAQVWSSDATSGASEHRFLFLDEPTTSLDVHFQLHLLDVARGLLDHDCTVVATLHDLNLAFEYGDHLFLLDRGKLAEEADREMGISGPVLERVFRVHAARLGSADAPVWRFTL